MHVNSEHEERRREYVWPLFKDGIRRKFQNGALAELKHFSNVSENMSLYEWNQNS